MPRTKDDAFTHYTLIAALAHARADRARAISALRRALNGFMWEIERQAAQRSLGLLLGGDEGAALIADAHAFFSAAGVCDVEHYAGRVLFPGFEITA